MEETSRRRFIQQMSFGTAALVLPGCLSNVFKTNPPNIIFIMTDDHAAQALSCYGSRINKTPNLDRIAREGMRFENCFCTNSICAPSRAVILTGKHSHINGVLDNRLSFDSSQMTFPKLLQQNGYTTAMIGKWHLKSDPTGFDYWNILPGQGFYYNPDFIEMGDRKQHIGYATDLITDFSLDWLQKRNYEKPFCLMYQHKAPHRNWMPGPKYLSLYDNETIPEPDNLFDNYENRGRAAHEQEMTISNHMFTAYDLKLTPPLPDSKDQDFWNSEFVRFTPQQRVAWNKAYGPKNEEFNQANLKGKELLQWKYQRYIKDYLRCIASVDENVGRLLEYLDTNDLKDNTIVIYTSDQGFYLGEHGWFDKRFMYEESLRMPLLVRYPREIEAASINDDIVQNIDFAPTFLDFAGSEIPEDIQGKSIRPLLNGQTPSEWRQSAYYHYYEYPGWHAVKRHYGIRTRRYKLIHFYYDIDMWELYDLKEDPTEMQNAYSDPAYSDVIEDLKNELYRLRTYYGDTDDKIYQSP